MFVTKAVPGWYQRINTSNVKRPEMMTYKAFCQANEARLKTLYPFLTQEQIKGKLFEQWKKSQPSGERLKMKPRSTIVKSRKKNPVVQGAPIQIHLRSDTSKRVQTSSLTGSYTSSHNNECLKNEQKAKRPGHDNRTPNIRPFILCAKAPEVTNLISNIEQSFITKKSIAEITSSTTGVTNKVTFSQSDSTKIERSCNPKDRHLIRLRNTEPSPAVKKTLRGNHSISAKQNTKLQTKVRKRTEGLESEAGFDSSSPEFSSVRTGKFQDGERKKFCLFEDEFPLDFRKSKKKAKTMSKMNAKMITSCKRATGSSSKSAKSDSSLNKRNRQIGNDSSNSDKPSASRLRKPAVSFPATPLEMSLRTAERDLDKKPPYAQNIKQDNKTCLESSSKKLSGLGCSEMSDPHIKVSRSSSPLSFLSLVPLEDQAIIDESVDKPVPRYEISVTGCSGIVVTAGESYTSAIQSDRNKSRTAKSAAVKGLNSKQLSSGKQTLTDFDNMSVSKTRQKYKSKSYCLVTNTSTCGESDITYDENKDSNNKAQCIVKLQPQSELTGASIVTSEENKITQSPLACSGSQKKMLFLSGPSKMSSKEDEMDGSNILLKIINQLKPARTCHSLVHAEQFEFSKDLMQPRSGKPHMIAEPIHGDEFPPQNQIQDKITEQRACRKRGNILCNMFEEVGPFARPGRYISSEDVLLPELDDGGFM